MDEHVGRLKTTIGIDSVQLASIGVYHYRLSDSTTGLSTCSIIANSGPRVRAPPACVKPVKLELLR